METKTSRIFATYPNHVVHVIPKTCGKPRKYKASTASWRRVHLMIERPETREYFRTRSGFRWEYKPAGSE